jgi:hypothetical protein
MAVRMLDCVAYDVAFSEVIEIVLGRDVFGLYDTHIQHFRFMMDTRYVIFEADIGLS